MELREIIKLTEEEFLQKYGDTTVRLSYYYKFTFWFIGVSKDGEMVRVTVGGSSDDIYRLDVQTDKEYYISDLGVNHAIIEKNNQRIFEFENYW
jgi:hypothetical protein